MPTSHLYLDDSLSVPKPAPNDGAYVLDRTWRIVDINDYALDHLGVSRSEAIGASLWSLALGLVGTECEKHYRRAMESRTVEEFVGPSAAHEGRWLEVRVFPVPDGLAVHLRDITPRVQLEAKLRDRERLLSAIFRQASAGFAQVDLEGRFELVNDAYCAITGYSREQLLGRRMQEITNPEDLDTNLELLKEALAGKNSFTIEKRYVRPDGSDVWVNNSVTVLRNDAGAPIGILAVTVDRTEAKRSEQQLRESEQRFRQMADAVPQIVWITDAEGNTEFFNRQWFEYTGVVNQPTTAAKVAADQVHPEDGPATIDAFNEARRTGTTFNVEHRIRGKDGEHRWFLVRGEPHRSPSTGEIVRWFGASVDIHDRKMAEQRLYDLNQTLEARIEERTAERDHMWRASRDLMCVARVDGKLLSVNPAWERLLGWKEEELVGRFAADIKHPEDSARTEAGLAQLAAGVPIDGFEDRYRHRDGSWRWISWSIEAVGELIYCAGRDVTAEKERAARLAAVELARREADALYRAYFENTAEALFVIQVLEDGGFVIEDLNPAHQASIGLPLAEVQGKRIDEILPPDLAEPVVAHYRATLEAGGVHQYREFFELHDRRTYWDTVLVPVRDHSGRIVRLIGSSRDLTGQMAAEEQLRQSQKMEAMGQLTGGVAHDFNNLLTPIVGALDMLQRKGIGDEREQRLIGGAAQSAERAKTLVQRLLAFARRQPLQPIAVDVGQLVVGMGDLIASTTGPQIKVTVDVGPDLPPASADPNQLEMALLNLAVNARDAMPEGGSLRISANAKTIGRPHNSGLQPGGYLVLSIADTGVGMDEATLTRAVEPFFSTKGIGKGTGLGLSMVHGLASQLGGALTIRSTPGLGTNVELWLPQSDCAQAKAEAATQATLPQGRGKVLLVDDEDLVRLSTADMLNEMGYQVSEVSSAEEALRLLQSGFNPDLVITDHLMPGMSGTDFARKIHEERPKAKVLIISGYAEMDGIAADLPRLTKPFRSDDLAQSLASL
jgi:PAS domain S-box-containing protein